ncbi:hypothetical protein [Actinomadura rupiterrae]|uniref:hypothetical protein n=1 Tax=Actinomadura rupiterrae TaxID=559627 RepID=UPI0020A24A15|nr:hypothetical protein [Actinomadura rupiterrae]MCP2335583.1 hypothetical protein [Actinomadura rupiterrae]
MPVDLARPVLDPTFGDPVARDLAKATAHGDKALLRRVAADTDDPDRRSFLLGVAVDHPGRPEWIVRWPDEEPEEALAHFVRGAHGILWAWEARGNARAGMTSEEQFREFHQRLAGAERDLVRAAVLAPDDPEPRVQLLTTARGLQLGTQELCHRFAKATARHPWHYRAHTLMLQGVAPKWSGSSALMFNFARSRAAEAPVGSAVASLVVEAHIETWVDEPDDETGYLAAPDVQRELRAVAARLKEAPDTPAALRAANLLAFTFALGGDDEAAAEQFRAIGSHVTESPWQYLARDVVTSFTKYRDRALNPA